ncbi:hypothetical protein M433DRAFT_1950 [Acidomyces richmondensis BFW]|nr:MAG: hypothetical protein FE78DRAFT_84576 [Acidomyces sp. 'richmondensis']KYG48517.1 hypothetical protein M433DRAFT_1950 [Acidomyces richmondensis BFW]
MSSPANRCVSDILRNAEPPPPVEARFFYTSPIPIDDPLSPVLPSASGQGSAGQQPPKPFSAFDNAALNKTWHELRAKLLRYNEEHAEKSSSTEGSRVRAGSRGVKDGRGGSTSRPATPRTSLTRQAATNLNQMERRIELGDDALSAGPPSAVSIAQLPDTTGTPFIRAPSDKKLSGLHDRLPRPQMQKHDTYDWDDSSHLLAHRIARETGQREVLPRANVPVGALRLHQVEMPEFLMQPIYWTPVHDTAQVVRGTWFYQDTMLPVETAVANMLEAGYIELQCWTETWKDELNSAIEVGALGEMKIVHKLWPDQILKPNQSQQTSRLGATAREDLARSATLNLTTSEPETLEQRRERAVQAACDIIDISSGPSGADNKAYGKPTFGRQGAIRTFATFGVIYANEREARLLKPSLLPSAYYGRRPLANYIRKGRKLGIPVVRGFDQAIWDKLHPVKDNKTVQKPEYGIVTSASGVAPTTRLKTDPELAMSERPKVSDLILVIHGIGQKLSERISSFHFTHAMNAFRRDVHVEAGISEVKTHFRRNMGDIMVLPVNWRHSLSFEEGGYRDEPMDPAINEFSLKDITPETLPSVRNIVSDVMLDIPYYMSHHQPKMIAAVVREANRVYQLWCQNNPGFSEHGRVHVIGHSLGSVIAIDILSRQPTTVPKFLQDPTKVDISDDQLDHFLFNTSNLFLAGSPAGFFLLLKKAQLLPRNDHPTASVTLEPTANTSVVCGERGQYGCLAVENVYNIINGYDPISYRMNAAVDSAYAASLKPAYIPSSSKGWFANKSGSTSWFGNPNNSQSKQQILPRLPSNVELDTHNFTREEIAEKRMYLLNDNGQIDYFLRYGGGPLDIQYLTMLSAHSSYWLLRDFTRMIVQEVGREPGKEGTILSMRAVKKKVPLTRDA